MNREQVNPEKYHWLLYLPWRECIILLAISFLGILLHILVTEDVVQAIITALSSNSYQWLLNLSILLFNIGWKGCIAIFIAETLIAIVQHSKGIHVVKSIKLTHYLQNSLKHTLDIIPEDNIDRRITASEVDSKRANKAIKESMVAVFQGTAYIFIRLPVEIGIRRNIAQYADEAATDIAEILNMRKAGRQVYQDHRSFRKYYYYELHN